MESPKSLQSIVNMLTIDDIKLLSPFIQSTFNCIDCNENIGRQRMKTELCLIVYMNYFNCWSLNLTNHSVLISSINLSQ